ncbi:cytochrome c3 family protein [Geobacter sp. SVR]|uniref:cytochrome c3 family protein n=1 Tax=Geobacter sp. SVR TaxID=2495594 RepID=UPI00143EFBAD|nr:cytochrome c3 family protein [Geobacter sp. SVR]BCS56003.1 cytochrome c [Geobacter sp. SVR]GCF84766.1 cytochrome c [Geobacter sp. SVR]
MKNHVLRPLYVALALVGFILFVRKLLVPVDFGIYERGYMYGWHRKSNEAEWKGVRIKYKTDKGCRDCHRDKYEEISKSGHSIISCENCHGPRYEHPKDPPGLTVDRSRGLCVRCHAHIPYMTGGRGDIPGIDPEKHYPQAECVMCHLSHNPKPMNQKREARS